MSRFVEEDIASYLESHVAWLRRKSSTTGGAQNFFLGDLPDQPLEAVALYEYQGDMPIYFMGGGGRIEKPRLQITARAARYDRARELIADIYDALEDKGPATIGGSSYLKFRAVSRPTEITPDGSNNSLFSVGFMVWRQV